MSTGGSRNMAAPPGYAGQNRGITKKKGQDEMSTNDILCELHAALVAKARESCRVAGSNKTAVEIADALMNYG